MNKDDLFVALVFYGVVWCGLFVFLISLVSFYIYVYFCT